MTRETVIAPSILATNFAKLGEEIAAIDAVPADWVHCDAMARHFAPNISFRRYFDVIGEFPAVEQLRCG